MAEPHGGAVKVSIPAGRPAPIDREPGTRLGKTLNLLDDIDRAARRVQPLLRTVHRMTGLPLAQVTVLMAFSPDGLMRSGATQDPTALKALAHKGFAVAAGPPHGEGSGETVWRLTDAGQAALGQLQGLRIRALGTLMDTLDDDRIDELHAAVRGIVDALDGFPAATHDAPETPT